MHLRQLSVNPRERMTICASMSTLLHQGFRTIVYFICSLRGGLIRTEPPHRAPHPSLSRSRVSALRWLWRIHLTRLYGGLGTNLHGSTGHLPMNMHKYPSLASNTLLLLHSFPSVGVGVATERVEASDRVVSRLYLRSSCTGPWDQSGRRIPNRSLPRFNKEVNRRTF